MNNTIPIPIIDLLHLRDRIDTLLANKPTSLDPYVARALDRAGPPNPRETVDAWHGGGGVGLALNEAVAAMDAGMSKRSKFGDEDRVPFKWFSGMVDFQTGAHIPDPRFTPGGPEPFELPPAGGCPSCRGLTTHAFGCPEARN